MLIKGLSCLWADESTLKPVHPLPSDACANLVPRITPRVRVLARQHASGRFGLDARGWEGGGGGRRGGAPVSNKLGTRHFPKCFPLNGMGSTYGKTFLPKSSKLYGNFLPKTSKLLKKTDLKLLEFELIATPALIAAALAHVMAKSRLPWRHGVMTAAMMACVGAAMRRCAGTSTYCKLAGNEEQTQFGIVAAVVLVTFTAVALRMNAAYGDAELLSLLKVSGVGLHTVLYRRFFTSWESANTPLLGCVPTKHFASRTAAVHGFSFLAPHVPLLLQCKRQTPTRKAPLPPLTRACACGHTRTTGRSRQTAPAGGATRYSSKSKKTKSRFTRFFYAKMWRRRHTLWP